MYQNLSELSVVEKGRYYAELPADEQYSIPLAYRAVQDFLRVQHVIYLLLKKYVVDDEEGVYVDEVINRMNYGVRYTDYGLEYWTPHYVVVVSQEVQVLDDVDWKGQVSYQQVWVYDRHEVRRDEAVSIVL